MRGRRTAAVILGLLFGGSAAVAGPAGRSVVDYPPEPDPGPTQTERAAKSVGLRAAPARVKRGKRTRLQATLEPCIPATRNDTVQFLKGGATIASLPVDDACRAELPRKVKKATSFSSLSPADADSYEAASDPVRVKVKKKKG